MAVKARLVTEELSGGNFMLVRLKGGDALPIYDDFGQLLKFETGEEAGRVADSFTARYGDKVQPRRINDIAWREREAKRMKDGTYQPLPWADTKWWAELKGIHEHHYPHVSLQKTALIAITEDEAKGSADIQTPMKPGKYLKAYFSEKISDYMIRDLACIFSSKYEDNKMQFADTADEIEEVFKEGPSSCMSKEAKDYSLPEHPTRMYAAGDLAVAYLRRQGRIVARSVVWPEKKLYNTIYGDSGRLSELLHKEGYKKGVPHGARLRRVTVDPPKSPTKGLYQFICPHVDNPGGSTYCKVRDDGTHLTVLEPTKVKPTEMAIEVPGGAGRSETCGYTCSRCHTANFTQKYIVAVYGATPDPITQCKNCAKKAKKCTHSGYLIDPEYTTELRGYPYWTRVLPEITFRCAGSGELHLKEEMVAMPDGQMWSRDYARKNARPCKCGAMVPAKQICHEVKDCHFNKKQTTGLFFTTTAPSATTWVIG